MIEQIGIFDRIKRGWRVAMTGWEFIKENPSCLVFSLISSLIKATFALSVVFFYMLYIVNKGVELAKSAPHLTDEQLKEAMSHKLVIPPVEKIALMFAFLFVCILISSIMYTALSYYMAKKIEGTPVSIGASIGRGFARFKTLCAWSLINAALTIIFNMIRNAAKDGKFPFNLIAQLVAGMLQFAWSVLTFFVFPIFALKDLGAIESIEESGSTMKKMWGQSIGATFNISFISFLAFAGMSSIGCLASYLLLPQPADIAGYGITIILVGILVNLWISTARTLFQTAAYLHSQGKSAGPFNADFIQTSFVAKPSK